MAKAAAAIEQRTEVTGDDLKLAVKLAIIPRGTTINDPNRPEDEMEQPPPPPPPQDNMEEEDDAETEDEPEADEDEQPDESAPPVPEEFMLDADGTVLDPSVRRLEAFCLA